MKLPSIKRPNGSVYRPRHLRSQALGNEDETTEIVVFGTHDIRTAEGVARLDLTAISREWSYRIAIDPRSEPRRVWYRQKLAGWYEDSPLYEYVPDEDRGAAGVEFSVITEFDSAYGGDPSEPSWPDPPSMFDVPGSADLVQGDAKLRGNSGDADANQDHANRTQEES